MRRDLHPCPWFTCRNFDDRDHDMHKLSNRPLEKQVHTDPDGVGTAGVLNVVQNFKERYIDSTYVKDPFFQFGGGKQEDTGEAAAFTVDRTDQLMKLKRSLVSSMVANLGTTCFGYVFERYMKLTQKGSNECEFAFGLQTTSTWVDFKNVYPSARLDPNVPWSPSGLNWLPRMIRNSFAHGGWSIRQSDPPEMTLWNEYQGTKTFNITLSVSDLKNLIYDALLSFITNVQPSPPTSTPGDPISPPSLSHEIVVSFIDHHKTNATIEVLDTLVKVGEMENDRTF